MQMRAFRSLIEIYISHAVFAAAPAFDFMLALVAAAFVEAILELALAFAMATFAAEPDFAALATPNLDNSAFGIT